MSAREVFQLFMTTKYQSFYGVRDNCGLAAIDLVNFFKIHGIRAERIKGHFHCDLPVHDPKDFTKAMKAEFIQSGLDFNAPTDRLTWLQSSPYGAEWLNCPHYWVEVEGEIFDPSGQAQFVYSGLAADTDTHRYRYL
jgi:hypothetical protein